MFIFLLISILPVLCGKWESYPREFAKCRRCRKAKYCGKECQSSAWSEGHRFWCSARDGDEEAGDQMQAQTGPSTAATPTDAPEGASAASTSTGVTAGTTGTVRGRHRQSHTGATPAQHQHQHGDQHHYHHNAATARGADVSMLPQAPFLTEVPGALPHVGIPVTGLNPNQQQQRSIATRRTPGGAEGPLLYIALPGPGARTGAQRTGQSDADAGRDVGMISVPYAVYTGPASRGNAAAGASSTSRTVGIPAASTSSQETMRADGSVISQTTPTQTQSRNNNPPLLNNDDTAVRGTMDHDMSAL
jgi:hypothetical protein